MNIQNTKLGQEGREKNKSKRLCKNTCKLAEATWRILSTPAWIFSRRKWQSTSMCLVCSWNTGFAAICRATWLSQNKTIAIGWEIWKSWSNARIGICFLQLIYWFSQMFWMKIEHLQKKWIQQTCFNQNSQSYKPWCGRPIHVLTAAIENKS